MFALCVSILYPQPDESDSHSPTVFNINLYPPTYEEEIQAESQAVLNTLRENDFQECFKNWQCPWVRCQASEGDYFEGDFC
jgi:hypothetical protein